MSNILQNNRDFQEMAKKFKKLSPKDQQQALKTISTIIENEKDEELKDLYQSFRNYFANLYKSKNSQKSDFADSIEDHRDEIISDLEGLTQIDENSNLR